MSNDDILPQNGLPKDLLYALSLLKTFRSGTLRREDCQKADPLRVAVLLGFIF